MSKWTHGTKSLLQMRSQFLDNVLLFEYKILTKDATHDHVSYWKIKIANILYREVIIMLQERA